MLYHNDHFSRAMFARLDRCRLDCLNDLDQPFRVARPMLAPTSSQMDRRAKNAPDFSVNWTCIDGDNCDSLEMIKTDSGRKPDGSTSRLAKSSLFSNYIRLLGQLSKPEVRGKIKTDAPMDSLWSDPEVGIGLVQFQTGSTTGSNQQSYFDFKRKSKKYEEIKSELYRQMKTSGLGIWVKKPEEIEHFCVDCKSQC